MEKRRLAIGKKKMKKGQILAHAGWFLEIFELDQLTPKNGWQTTEKRLRLLLHSHMVLNVTFHTAIIILCFLNTFVFFSFTLSFFLYPCPIDPCLVPFHPSNFSEDDLDTGTFAGVQVKTFAGFANEINHNCLKEREKLTTYILNGDKDRKFTIAKNLMERKCWK